MKRKLIAALIAATLTTGLVAGCGSSSTDSSSSSSDSDSKELETIVVGAVPTPHAEVLEQIKDDLEEEGYELEIKEFNDYVIPNQSLSSGDLDANYFQHKPYLDNYNDENGTDLVAVAPIHFEALAIYPGKTTSLDDLKEGAKVLVPNDTTNEARALLLLEENGLITLPKDADLNVTVADIVENPLNLEIVELEAANVARSIQDADIACVNGNYALEAELTDPLAIEDAESQAADTYANYVVVRAGDEETAKTKALVKAIQSDEVRDFINEKYNGLVVPVF